jgi:hypothetical protein
MILEHCCCAVVQVAACELLFQLPLDILVNALSEAQWSGVLQAGLELYNKSAKSICSTRQQQQQAEDIEMEDAQVGDELSRRQQGKLGHAPKKGKAGRSRCLGSEALDSQVAGAAATGKEKASMSARASKLFASVLKEVIQLNPHDAAKPCGDGDTTFQAGGVGGAGGYQGAWHGHHQKQQQYSSHTTLLPCQRVLLRLLQEEGLTVCLQGVLTSISQTQPMHLQ